MIVAFQCLQVLFSFSSSFFNISMYIDSNHDGEELEGAYTRKEKQKRPIEILTLHKSYL